MVDVDATVMISSGLEDVKCCGESCLHHVVDRVYISISPSAVATPQEVHMFRVDNVLFYEGFCDDFGPMGLKSVFEFCRILEEQVSQHPNQKVALSTDVEKRAVTNAIFLMGSYLIMKRDWTVEEVKERFQPMYHCLATFRDVSPGKQNFHLHVEDCWGGLHRAKGLGWVDFGPKGFQVDEYSQYDDPLNADLHEIVPNKFVAMRGPKTIPGGALWYDHFDSEGHFSHRDFSPSHFAKILAEFGVSAVVRLNSREYSDQEFLDAGIAVADLHFDDCTAPPIDVVAKFLLICEKLPGAIAVHCKAGLGRTGTLIALYMMKHYDFSAREAMGWLRIVRPGSVIGDQQRYLCEHEEVMRRAGAVFRNHSSAVTPTGRESATTSPQTSAPVPVAPAAPPADLAGVAAVQRLLDDTVRYIDVRIKTMKAPTGVARGGSGGNGVAGNRFSSDAARGGKDAAAAKAAAAGGGGSDRRARREEWLGAHVMSASNARATRRAVMDVGLRFGDRSLPRMIHT